MQKEFKHEQLTHTIIGCAMEVHKLLGPGLLESAYEECLVYELIKAGLNIIVSMQEVNIFTMSAVKTSFKISQTSTVLRLPVKFYSSFSNRIY